MKDQSEHLKMRLASVGIFLDEPKKKDVSARAETPPIAVDRARVREILVSAGAPERDVEWLTRSCPSLEHAYGYRPPEKAK